MFYCEPCRQEKGWPLAALGFSVGRCEICGHERCCHDVPSSALPAEEPYDDLCVDCGLPDGLDWLPDHIRETSEGWYWMPQGNWNIREGPMSLGRVLLHAALAAMEGEEQCLD